MDEHLRCAVHVSFCPSSLKLSIRSSMFHCHSTPPATDIMHRPLSVSVRLALLFLTLTSTAEGQPQPDVGHQTEHVLGIDIGVLQLREDNLLPRVHSGFLLHPSYTVRCKEDAISELRFVLGYGRAAAEPEDMEISVFTSAQLSYSYEFPTYRSKSINAFAGPVLRTFHTLSYFPNWDDSHLYWATVFSLGFNGRLHIPAGERKNLMAELSLPLITLYSRPEGVRPYKIDDLSFGGILDNLHSDMRSGFWGNAFLLRFNAEYEFPLAQSMREAVFFEMEYIRIAKPNGLPFRVFTHNVGLKVYL